MPAYLDSSKLYACKDERGRIAGFLGMSGSKVEMLFVDAAYRGTGVGRKLLSFAIRRLKAERLDVNEQNEQAIGFYVRFGFRAVRRSETDAEGKNYPVLHMELPDVEENH